MLCRLRIPEYQCPCCVGDGGHVDPGRQVGGALDFEALVDPALDLEIADKPPRLLHEKFRNP